MVARAPRKRMYRSMQGKMIDIDKLRTANEDVRAVGNMNVNARGDVVAKSGNVVKTKAQVIKKYYEQPKGVVDDTPSRNKQTPALRPTVETKQTVKTMKVTPKEEVKKTAVAPVSPKVEETSKPVETFKPKTESTAKKGIDAALDGLE